MKFLVKLYDKSLIWSQHQYAPRYLAAVSFVEASFFPIPPYFMLAPMSLAKPKKALNYALIATLASVAGGVLGYILGYLIFYPVILPFLEFMGYATKVANVAEKFRQNEFWMILAAGLIPIPYKLIAISAGFMHAALLPFLLASLIGRGLKFFLLAAVIKIGGVDMEQKIRRSIERFGLFLLAIIGLILGLKFFKVI